MSIFPGNKNFRPVRIDKPIKDREVRQAMIYDYERACNEHGAGSEYAREMRAQLEKR